MHIKPETENHKRQEYIYLFFKIECKFTCQFDTRDSRVQKYEQDKSFVEEGYTKDKMMIEKFGEIVVMVVKVVVVDDQSVSKESNYIHDVLSV